MREAESRRRSVWSWVASLALAAALLYFAVRGVEWRRVWQTIEGVAWRYVVLSGLLCCGSFFLRSLRWRILLNAETRLSVGAVFSATMAGYLGNNFLPARAGELVRTFIISSRSPLSKTYVLTTALAERMMDAVFLVLWGSIVLLGVNPKPGWLQDVSWGTALIGAGGAFAIAVVPHTGKLCEAILARIPMPAALRERILGVAAQVLAGLRVFHDVRRFAGFVLMTVVIWSVDAASMMIGGYAFGLGINYTVAALLLCGMGLGSAVAPTPGYVGTYQSVAVTVLTPFGISKDEALAFILVSQAAGYVVVTILGLPAILRYRGWKLQKAEAAGVSDR